MAKPGQGGSFAQTWRIRGLGGVRTAPLA